MTLTVSSKQYDSIRDATSRFNLWVGAVRSGKTFASLCAFEGFLKHGPAGDYAIIGKSRDTIKRNILGPLKDMLGWRLSYSLGRCEANLYGRTIHIIGANDERAEHRIRGLTLAGAYVDEVTIIPEPVFKMLGSRLSVPGARLFGTTNPDSPFHWLKTDYIDRAADLDLRCFDFALVDNPSLDPRFVANLKREYRGLWYQRYIEGKWVLAEGTVYDFFDESLHVLDYPPGAAEYYVVGVDYGTTNPCAFAMIGYSTKTQPNKWLEREWYWDSKRQMRQMTDSEYAEALKKFIGGYPVRAIYVDPSAASFKLELSRQGFSGVIEAENEVLDGIRYHGMQLGNGTYKVMRSCKQAIEEYCTYRWDPRAAERGEDKPLKDNDHMLDAVRYALYSEWYAGEGPRLKAEDVERLREEAMGSLPRHGRFYDDVAW